MNIKLPVLVYFSLFLCCHSVSAYGNSSCLLLLRSEQKTTQAELDNCVKELALDKENAQNTFVELITALSNEKYQSVQRYFISSGVILTLQPMDTVFIYQKFLSMHEVLKKLVRKNLIEESLILQHLDKLVLPCTFNATVGSYNHPSEKMLRLLKEYLIESIHPKEDNDFDYYLRMAYSKYIVEKSKKKMPRELAIYYASCYPYQLSIFINSATNNGRKDLSLSDSTKDIILRNLFGQIEERNTTQSYQIIKSIEAITDLQFINKFFRYPDRVRHFAAVKKKALNYYRKNYGQSDKELLSNSSRP